MLRPHSSPRGATIYAPGKAISSSSSSSLGPHRCCAPLGPPRTYSTARAAPTLHLRLHRHCCLWVTGLQEPGQVSAFGSHHLLPAITRGQRDRGKSPPSHVPSGTITRCQAGPSPGAKRHHYQGLHPGHQAGQQLSPTYRPGYHF